MARRDGQIIARGKGSWRIRWHLGGRRYGSKTIHGTKRDARAELNKVLAAQGRGDPEPSRRTLDEYLDKWLESAVDPKLAPKTASSYRWLPKKRTKWYGTCRRR